MTTPLSPASISYPLVGEAATVVLNGSGTGTARWTPGQQPPGCASAGVGIGRTSGYSVDVDSVAVSVGIAPGNTAILNEAQAALCVSWGTQDAVCAAGSLDFQSQTSTGSHGDTDTVGQTLRPGDWITVTWTGGDANALATMKIFGTVNIGAL
jgi:hypothetical protein